MKKVALQVLVLGLIVMLLLTACAPAATSTAEPTKAPEEAQPAPTQAEPAQPPAETVTLVVWDQYARDVESEVMNQINKEFEEAHPGVKIERVVKSFDDLKTTIKLALGQPDGPDVAQVNQGQDMVAIVAGDLLLPLDDYATKYKWREIFPESLNSRNSATATGFGQGNLYGMSVTAEFVGVYYNKGMFEKYGWKLPTTFDEFTKLLADIKAAGETPITFGDLDGWPGIHTFSSVQHVLVDVDYINNFTYGLNNVSFDIPENREAAKIVQGWAKDGYFTDGFMGIGYDDSLKIYKSGQGALMITGTWAAGEFVTDTDQKFGNFLMPQKTVDTPQLAIGGVGLPFCIRKGTKNADLAAEYINFLVSPRAAQLWAEKGMLPAAPLPADYKVEEGTLLADQVAAWGTLLKSNGIGHYIDWATLTMYDTLNAELQKLFAGETTPEQFTAAIQADYAKR
ncbi:MAG: extracellular solute-binding protein [Anaerolineales bacterium]